MSNRPVRATTATEHAIHADRVGNITYLRIRASTGGSDRRGGLFRGAGIQIQHDHVRALPPEHVRNRAVRCRSRRRDGGHLAAEIEQVIAGVEVHTLQVTSTKSLYFIGKVVQALKS